MKRILALAALVFAIVVIGLGCGLYSLMKIPLGGKLVEPTPNTQPTLRLPNDVYWRGALIQAAVR